MALYSSRVRYSHVAVTFHWVIALLIFTLFPLGLYMAAQDINPQVLKLYSLHKSLGITVLTLAVLRIAWRLFNPPPPLPSAMPMIQKIASYVVHGLLYLGMLAIPLTGWAASSSAGFAVAPFGLFTLPNIAPKDHDLHELMGELHEIFAYLVMALVVLHLAAALYHQFVQKDNLLARMSFFGPSRIG